MFCILIYFLLALRDNLNSRLSTKCCAWLTTKYDCRTPLTALRRNLLVLFDSHRSQSEIGPPARRLVAWYRLASLNYISCVVGWELDAFPDTFLRATTRGYGKGHLSPSLAICLLSALETRGCGIQRVLPSRSRDSSRNIRICLLSCWYIPI